MYGKMTYVVFDKYENQENLTINKYHCLNQHHKSEKYLTAELMKNQWPKCIREAIFKDDHTKLSKAIV